MKLNFGWLLAGAVTLGCATVVTAAPVMPQHLWLFDELVDSNNDPLDGSPLNATPDSGVSAYPIKLYAGELNSGTVNTTTARDSVTRPIPQLVKPNDSVLTYSTDGPDGGTTVDPAEYQYYTMPASAVPFSYDGNNAHLNDWSSTGITWSGYPFRYSLMPYTGDLAVMPNGGLAIGTSGAISFWVQPIRHNGSGFGNFFSFARSSRSFFASANPYNNDTSGGKLVDGARVETAGTDSTPANNINPEVYGTDVSNPVNDDPLLNPNHNGIEFPPYVYKDESTYPYLLHPTDTTGVNFFGWGDDFNTGTAANGNPSGTWTNFVFNWSPGQMDVYLNGVLFRSAAMNMPTNFYANAIGIGSKTGNMSPFAGLFDDFAIWDTPLSASDISWLQSNSLYYLLNPIPEPASATLLAMGLIGLARFRRRRLAA